LQTECASLHARSRPAASSVVVTRRGSGKQRARGTEPRLHERALSSAAARSRPARLGRARARAARAQEGVIALWKGWLPSVIGVVPYVGLNFAVYETLKDVVLKFYGAPARPRPLTGPTSLVSRCAWSRARTALAVPACDHAPVHCTTPRTTILYGIPRLPRHNLGMRAFEFI